jgi:glycosyltransferase involved in cell wall biosynthesis
MKISIVTISFNQAAFLPTCLNSVAVQSRPGDEHVCVDPGSTDDSRAIILSQPAARAVFQPDDGPADGLNRGFAVASGDIGAFINADDELAPGALDYVRDFFTARPDVDMLLGAVRVIDARGDLASRKKVPSTLSLAAVAGGTMAFYQQGMFFRRRVWTELGVRFNVQNRTCWDYEFLSDALKAGARGVAVTRELGRFRIHPQSITGSGRLNVAYARDRARIEDSTAKAAGGPTPGRALASILTKVDPLRRLAEYSSWGDAPEPARDDTLAERSCVRVIVAWQGLPFYARRCLALLVRQRPSWEIVAVTDELGMEVALAEKECGCRVLTVQSDRKIAFAHLGLSVPDHLFATSWTHHAYRALGEETRRQGGGVTMLADNCFLGTFRQWAGALYFRTLIRPAFDDVWIPGKSGRRFMEVMGMPRERIHDGLLAGDEKVFSELENEVSRAGVIYAGKLIALKRVLELWRAWQSVGTSVSLTFVGEGVLSKQLSAEGARLAGRLDASGLAKRFHAASALILVSTVDHWGLVVHEAALCGCLILITATCGAADDLVVHRKNGYVMRGFSTADLSEALAWMQGLTDAERTAGRELSVALAKQFSPQRWAERAFEIVQTQSAERATRIL